MFQDSIYSNEPYTYELIFKLNTVNYKCLLHVPVESIS